MTRLREVLVGAVLYVLLVGTWILGEVHIGIVPSLLLVPLLAIAVAAAPLARAPLPLRLLSPLLAGALVLVAYLGGSHARSRAFNACNDEGERIHARLATYRVAHGHYPERLYDVYGPAMPCGRPLTGTLLHYRRDGDGYEIGFSDGLVSFHGDAQRPMRAFK